MNIFSHEAQNSGDILAESPPCNENLLRHDRDEVEEVPVTVDPLEAIGIDRTSLNDLKALIRELRQEGLESEATLVERNVADRREIAAFVDALFRYAESGFVQFRCFIHPDGGEKTTTWRYPWPGASIKDREALIDRATEFASTAALADKRVVFCPPVVTLKDLRSARNDDVVEGPALSVECDEAPGKARKNLVRRLGRQTCTVEFGGEWVDPETGEVQPKLHLHWRLTEPTRTPEDHNRLKLARDLAARLVGADTTAVPLVHPLRWPGSFHRKGAPRLARLVELNPDVEIELPDALELLQDAVEATGREVTPPATRVSGQLVADDPIDLSAAVAILENPDLTWAEWNEIGMAIWAATEGSETGRALWLAFSAKSSKSNNNAGQFDAAAAHERWKHYPTSPPTKIGAGTLFWLAEKACPGWMRPSKHAHKARADVRWVVAMQETSQSMGEVSVQADPTCRYRMTEAGLFYEREPPKTRSKPNDDEPAKPVWLSPPFEVVARTRDPDGNWGKLLRWNDHDGGAVTWVMPARLLGGHRDDLWQALYERGLEISSATEARNLLLAYLTHANPADRAEVVSRLGWHDHETGAAFVLPDQVFGGATGMEIIYAGVASGNPYRVRGSLYGQFPAGPRGLGGVRIATVVDHRRRKRWVPLAR
jgi:hypothetical protein